MLYSGDKDWAVGYWGWLRKNVDKQYFRHRLLKCDRSEQAIFSLLMQIYADKKKESPRDNLILGEKTPTHLYYVPTLFEWFPQAKVIQTFRDPRAIFVSNLKKVRKGKGGLKVKVEFLPGKLLDPFVAPVELLHITKAWLDAVRLHIKYEQLYPQRYRMVRFEDLINKPEIEVRQICDFLDIPFATTMLEEIAIVGSSFQSQRRVSGGFDMAAAERWQDHINPFVKAWFSISGKRQLQKFGYTP
jgi:hypothetical protein